MEGRWWSFYCHRTHYPIKTHQKKVSESGDGGERKATDGRGQRRRRGGVMKCFFGRGIKKRVLIQLRKDLWPNADVVVNPLVLRLSRNLPAEALGNAAVPQSTSCLHVNVHKWHDEIYGPDPPPPPHKFKVFENRTQSIDLHISSVSRH